MTRLWFRAALLAQGWARGVRVGISDGMIATVETDAPARAGDERHGFALPGLPNLHSHAFQRAMAGRAEHRGPDGDNFWTWRTQMYRLAEAVRPDDLEAIAALAYAEMLEAGFTRVGEFHYVHHDTDGAPFDNPAEMGAALAAAAARTGIGLTLLPVFYAHSGFGGLAPTAGQRRFIHDIDSFAGMIEASRRAIAPLGDARLGVAPHSLRAVTPEELAQVSALVPDGPVHIHIAEQLKEVQDCLAWSGQRPVEWLLAHAQIDPRWCLVHATHADLDEIKGVAASGAVVGLCPITEANLGDGIFPADDLLANSGAFGIGSDSNVLIDATEELRLLEYGQRLTRQARNVLGSAGGGTAASLYDGARLGGCRALGEASEALCVGAPATFLSLDAEHPSMSGAAPGEILDRWIFAARRPVVDCVWRNGRKVVVGGRHVDWDSILAAYNAAIRRLSA